MVQIMIHKPGRTYDKRKNWRPITLANDAYKVFDLCFDLFLSRETGLLQEPPPGEEAARSPKVGETQYGFRHHVRCARFVTP